MSTAPPTVRPFDDDLSTRLLHQRIVVLGQEVDDTIANRVCAQLLLLSAEDPRRDIALYINSPGGSVSAALAMYDTMRLIPNDVATLAMGLAASAAQFLLSAGTPGKRFALRHSRVLMHQPSGGIGGTAIDIAIQAQNMAHVKRTMQSLTAEHTGQSVETIERDADRDALVHRRGGARVRVHRPGGRAPRRRAPGRVDATGGSVMAGQYTIPVVIEQRPTGERASDVYSRLLTDRIIFLGTEIDDGVANVVIAQLLHLQSESQDSPIHLYINSPGGSITALLAVYDTIQYIKPTVATFCLGQAASAAAVLLAAGTPGNRHVLEHARVLLHQPSGGGEGTAADLEIQAREIARLREQVDEILHRHTGQPLAKLRTDTERDLILTAQQAVDYGLADRVVTTLKEVPPIS